MDEQLVTIERFDWLTDAHMAQCRLEASGIASFVPDEATASLCWHYGRAIGGVRLQVMAEELEDARAVLEEAPEAIEEEIQSPHEAVTERALRSAVFGTVFGPLDYYAIWVLLPVFGWHGERSEVEWRNIAAASMLLGLRATILALVMLAWVRR